MILEAGKIYNAAQLAEWFRIKPKSFSNNKIKKLKELEEYCKFNDLGRKGVEVIEVYIEEYKTAAKEKVAKSFEDCWGNSRGEKLDTGKNVARKIKQKYNLDTKEQTLSSYVNLERKKQYGKINTKHHINPSGEKGSCRYVFCKRVGDEYLPFTASELEIKKELYKKYKFDEETEEYAMWKEAFLDGDISEQDWIDFCKNYQSDKWANFKAELSKELNCICTYATLLELKQN